MTCARKTTFSSIFAGLLLAMVLLPDFLGAVPVGQRKNGDAAEDTKLARHKRSISWYKQHSDFWNWYKYFTDTGNTKGVEEMDRLYLTYLQNKNRAEARRSYKIYLRHLGDIYKLCADSDDPNCVASYTARPKPTPKPEPPKPAPIKHCDPYRDPYCLFSMMYPRAPMRAPAPVKAPAPVIAPARSPASGYFYYAPTHKPFLTAEQKAELLRICDAEDVECLQYHLRAAYGHMPSAGPAPSYAHLGCDPKKDPNCMPQLVQRAPSGMYYRYPTCDQTTDPYCLLRMHQAAQNQQAPEPPAGLKRPCNPLLDDNCNPLTAMRPADLSQYMSSQDTRKEQDPQDEPAPAHRAPCDPRYDPYCRYRTAASAMMRRPRPHAPLPAPFEEPLVHPRLGVRGKTREGYDCYIGYDEECLPLPRRRVSESRPRSFGLGFGVRPEEHYEPHINADGTRNGVIEPDPDCDPEYDSNCRLRRYEPPVEPEAVGPAAEEQPQEQPEVTEEHKVEQDQHEEPHHQQESYQEEPGHQEDSYHHVPGYEQQPEAPAYDQQHYEPYQSGQEDPYASYGPQDQPSSHFDGLGGYSDQYPRYDDGQDHRSYTGEYRKK